MLFRSISVDRKELIESHKHSEAPVEAPGPGTLRPCRPPGPPGPPGPQAHPACLAVSQRGTCLDEVGNIPEMKPVPVGFYSGLHGEKVSLGCVHLLRHPRAVFDFADRKASARSTSASSEFCARLRAKPRRVSPTAVAPWSPRSPMTTWDRPFSLSVPVVISLTLHLPTNAPLNPLT